MSGVTGVQHPRTSWQRIREFELRSFGEADQRAIGEMVASAHASVMACEATSKATEQLKQAAMRQLLTRGLRSEPLKQTEIGLIPASWETRALGDLGRIGNGSTPKRAYGDYWVGGTYPWLTSAKVYDREIKQADYFVTPSALRECHLPRLKPGTVLLAITGQGKTLGHCAVLRTEATISQHLAYIAVVPTIAEPSFIRAYLESKYDLLRRVASGGGSTKGALTCGFLRALTIPVPSMAEQREIVDILEAIDRKMESNRRKQALLEGVVGALVNGLMAGELRVSDPDASPQAAHLVEEMRAPWQAIA